MPSRKPLSYFIYYRVAQAPDARPCVERLQRGLRERLGIQGRLLAKSGDPALWMEIYEGVADAAAFENLLAILVEEAAFANVLAPGSERRTERFEDASCA